MRFQSVEQLGEEHEIGGALFDVRENGFEFAVGAIERRRHPATRTRKSGDRPTSVRNHAATAAVPSTPSTVAMIAMPRPEKPAWRFPMPRVQPGRLPWRTSAPSSSRSSRRSSCGRSSRIAACRSAIDSGLAGASSQAASVSSPERVRAVHNRSKSEPVAEYDRDRRRTGDRRQIGKPRRTGARPTAFEPRQTRSNKTRPSAAIGRPPAGSARERARAPRKAHRARPATRPRCPRRDRSESPGRRQPGKRRGEGRRLCGPGRSIVRGPIPRDQALAIDVSDFLRVVRLDPGWRF